MAIIGTRCLTDVETALLESTLAREEQQKNTDTENLQYVVQELKLLNMNMSEATETGFTLDDIEDC